MRIWKVMLLLNLALAAGLLAGYGFWGRQASRLGTELEQLQAETLRLQRERDAAAAGAQPGMQQWAARGIVRGAYPQLVMVSHEAITGLLPARTTGFRLAGDLDRSLARAGEAVRFWLQGTSADDSVIVRLEAW
jgi:hypothetical protein